MRKSILLMALLPILTCCHSGRQERESLTQMSDRVYALTAEQYSQLYSELSDGKIPQSLRPDGSLRTTGIYSWISGFFPGSLWQIYMHGSDERFREMATQYTELLEPVKLVTDNHDVGFMLMSSFGLGLSVTGNETWADVLIQGARSLSTRFNPATGCIQSWSAMPDQDWVCPVIIDNMMNLELLMWAFERTGETEFRDIAVTHADTTIRNHFREDGSTFHVVDYDPATGDIRYRQTKQGYADSSAWARGQSWGLYGFTMMYRKTGYTRYLEQAEKIADYLIPRLPEDGVPYWDYDSPDIPEDYRDTSAAAIMASALIELSEYSEPEKAAIYLATADRQLRSLCSDEYLAAPGEMHGFLLRHGVGNLPGNSEIDTPLTYGDFYLLEALRRITSL